MDKEIRVIIEKIPKNKATGYDQIPIELIQCLGEEGKQVIVDLVQKIYNDEELPPDFVNNIFIPLPKSSKAVRCEDHRTISLVSHTAKIVLILSRTEWHQSSNNSWVTVNMDSELGEEQGMQYVSFE